MNIVHKNNTNENTQNTEKKVASTTTDKLSTLSKHAQQFEDDLARLKDIEEDSSAGADLLYAFQSYKEAFYRLHAIRLKHIEADKEIENKKQLIEAYKVVGGVLNQAKATTVSLQVLAGAIPFKVSTKVRNATEKFSHIVNTLTRSPLQKNREEYKSRLENIEERLNQIAETPTSTYLKKARDTLEKGKDNFSKKLHLTESFLLQQHLSGEKRAYKNKDLFKDMDIAIDPIASSVLVKLPGDTRKRIAYTCEDDGFLSFNGHTSLTEALKHTSDIDTQAPADQAEITTAQENTESTTKTQDTLPPVLTQERRSDILSYLAKDKHHTFVIPEKEQEAFLKGELDTISLQHGANPDITVKVHLSLKEDSSGIRTILATYENNTNIPPFPLMQQGPAGTITWASTPQTEALLKEFIPVEVTEKDKAEAQSSLHVASEHITEVSGSEIKKKYPAINVANGFKIAIDGQELYMIKRSDGILALLNPKRTTPSIVTSPVQ